MDKQSRVDQAKIRSQKAQADRAIWAKVPPKKITRAEASTARRRSPQREVIVDKAIPLSEGWDMAITRVLTLKPSNG